MPRAERCNLNKPKKTMLPFTPTQADLEAEIPAFIDAEGRIFQSLAGHFQRILNDAVEVYAIDDHAPADLVRTYVYNRAAFEALPTLDLIATENGFAVVSNQHLAPASRERVQALREELYRKADTALSTILFRLQDVEEWRASHYAMMARNTLLWLPTLAARYGLAKNAGSFLSFEAFDELRPHILDGETAAIQLIGEAQMSDFVARQDTADLSPDDTKAIELIRIYMAVHVLCALGHMKRAEVHKAYRRAYDFIDAHADQFPHYKTSTTYEANHFEPHRNQPTDPCFFFG